MTRRCIQLHDVLFLAHAIILLDSVNAFVPFPFASYVWTRDTTCTYSQVRQDPFANDGCDCSDNGSMDDNRRKTLLSLGLIQAATMAGVEPAEAARRQPFTFLVTKKNSTSAESFRKDPVDVETPALSSEICLIRLLPVKNPVFKSLDGYIQALSSLRSESEQFVAFELVS